MPSKAAYFTAQPKIFSNANRPKTSPNLIFCFIKMAHSGTFIICIMNLVSSEPLFNYSLCNLPSIIVSVQFLTHEFLNTLILDLFCVIEKEFFDQNARTGYRSK